MTTTRITYHDLHPTDARIAQREDLSDAEAVALLAATTRTAAWDAWSATRPGSPACTDAYQTYVAAMTTADAAREAWLDARTRQQRQ